MDIANLSDLQALLPELLIEVAMNMEVTDINSLGRSSPTLTWICTDNHFWRRKLYKDYGVEVVSNALPIYRVFYGDYLTFIHPNDHHITLSVGRDSDFGNMICLIYTVKEGDVFKYFPKFDVVNEIIAILGPNSCSSDQRTPEDDESTDYVQSYDWLSPTDDSMIELLKYGFDNGYMVEFEILR
jgi:hypothetical protein